jgi:5-methylcytosine-specific restriction endonuclease McrA
MKEWYRRNKDTLTVRRKANYEVIRDAHLAQKREYYIKNRDAIRAKKKMNREPERRNEDIRRARKSGATVGDLRLIAEWEKRWRRKLLVRCYWCRSDIKPSVATRDHIVPLARGGEHSVSNLVVSCGSCNSKKHARSLDKWNATLEQPVLL